VPKITYGELRRRVARLQRGISSLKLKPGDRVVMLAPISIDFFALALALLASGMVLVFLDGRLDRRRLLRVLKAARPHCIVSIHQALRLWPLLPVLWNTRRIVTDRDQAPFGTTSLVALLGNPDDAPTEPEVTLQPEECSALLSFTSGTTGRPKGADRTHGILLAQHLALKAHAPDRQGEIDMPCFPAVVLHNLACGIGSVLPPIDLRHPAAADPARVLTAMRRFGVTSISGAPAYMSLLCDQVQRGDAAPPLRRLIIGGAPVSRQLARRLLASFPGAIADAVYGSTEAEPMTGVSLSELAESEGEGYLVGRASPVADLALVDLPELAPPLPPSGLSGFRVPEGASGEVLVRGPHVNQRYIGDDEAVRRYKVRDPDGSLWHRTGDLARRDATGRLWLTGRLPDRFTHRGRLLLPFVIEAALSEAIPEARQAALIAHPAAPDGELVVTSDRAHAEAVTAAARGFLAGRALSEMPVRWVPEIPTDARHNSKIDRPALREQLARSGGS
jgi:acyl-CoA synthetase (AMP-forming)/AMP-acid ligase II